MLEIVRDLTKFVESADVTCTRITSRVHETYHTLLTMADAKTTSLAVPAAALAGALATQVYDRLSYLWLQPCPLLACAVFDPTQRLTFVDDAVIAACIDVIVKDSMNDFDQPRFDNHDSLVQSARTHRVEGVRAFRTDVVNGDASELPTDDVLELYRLAAQQTAAAKNKSTADAVKSPPQQVGASLPATFVNLLELMPNTIRAYLSMPTSSAAVERLFSCAGDVADNRMLGNERLEMETVMRAWLKHRCDTVEQFRKVVAEFSTAMFQVPTATARTASNVASSRVFSVDDDNFNQ